MTNTIPTISAPEGLTDDDELPLRDLPDIPLWSENYCFTAYDPATKTGLWLHLGRAPFDPRIWREIVAVYLPSGDFLVTKGFVRSDTSKGPSGPSMALNCLQPWNTWSVRFDGAAVRTGPADLDRTAVRDDLHHPLAFELSYEALSPVFKMGEEMRKQSWGHVHYEQLCRVHGPIRLPDGVIEFDGVGIRDHTRGPRDMNNVDRHVWLHGVFPSGRAFIVLDFKSVGHRLTRAVVMTDGIFQDAELVHSPLLDDQRDADTPYDVTLRVGGEETTIRGRIVHNLPFGLVPENEITIGSQTGVSTHWLFEGHTQFTWDGETGHGLTERTLPRSESAMEDA